MEITYIDFHKLIGAQVFNQHGARFILTSIQYAVTRDEVIYNLSELDEETGEVVPDSESGVLSLAAFSLII